MPLTKLSPAGNNFWLVTSRLVTGKSLTFLQCTLLLREIVSLLQKTVLLKIIKLFAFLVETNQKEDNETLANIGRYWA
jgi:hypothetical protein